MVSIILRHPHVSNEKCECEHGLMHLVVLIFMTETGLFWLGTFYPRSLRGASTGTWKCQCQSSNPHDLRHFDMSWTRGHT